MGLFVRADSPDNKARCTPPSVKDREQAHCQRSLRVLRDLPQGCRFPELCVSPVKPQTRIVCFIHAMNSKL